MRIGSLFSGYAGLEMAVQAVLGGDVAWHSEVDPGACKILAHRYPDVPNLGDITAVDWSAVEPVDVLTGGSPCQDLSQAGKRAGMTEGTRSNLWVAMREAIAQLRPPLVVWENVQGALSACADSEMGQCPGCVGDGPHRPLLRALGRVLGDLADLGYDASWQGLRASDVGAPHGRFRVFVVAWDARDADGLARASAIAQRRRSEAVDESRAVARAVGSDRAPAAAYPDKGGRGPDVADLWAGQSDAGRRAAADPNCSGRGRLEELHAAAEAWEGACDGDDAHGLAVAAGGVDWGPYGDAVRRWERRLGRPAPFPRERGRNGQPRLAPAFVEWVMGLPAGWVTDPAIWAGVKYETARRMQLHVLGNGVVWQQAAHALPLLLVDVPAGVAA